MDTLKELKDRVISNIKSVQGKELINLKKFLIPSRSKTEAKLFDLIETELRRRKIIPSRIDKLEAGKDFGKYRSPIKESNMKLSNRLEKLIVKEEETMVDKLETPIQSTGSTPEPVKTDVSPSKEEPKEEPKKEEPKESEHDKKFKEQLKAIMKKVKENQTVEWKNLIDLLETFEKTDLNKE